MLVAITILMLMGYSPGYSATIGIVTCIVTCIVVSWFRKETRVDLRGFVGASRAGAEASLKIGATIGVIGLIITFVLVFSGTWFYSWLLSGIWLSWFRKKPQEA
jgi:TRAP-type uncharacterized transport system fused permease subunit